MKKYDVILILGKGVSREGKLSPRGISCAEKAVQLYKESVADKILVTGKYSYQIDYVPPVTEAEALKRELVKQGVPEQDVIKEEESNTTVSNLYFSKKILLKRNWQNIIIVSTALHLERSKLNATKVLGDQFNIKMIPADYEFPEELRYRVEREKEHMEEAKKFLAQFRDGDDETIYEAAAKDLERIIKSQKAINLKMLNYGNDIHLSSEAANILRDGGVAILPFDTVYGIVCDPRNDRALEKIFKFKNRPKDQTIGLAVDSLETLRSIADLSKESEKFIAGKTPGKYTFIVQAKKNTNISSYCQKNNTFGIRIPDASFILEVVKKAGGIIAQTSANKTGEPNNFSIDDLRKQYSEDELKKIDLVVDGRIPSTSASEIYDLTGLTPRKIER